MMKAQPQQVHSSNPRIICFHQEKHVTVNRRNRTLRMPVSTLLMLPLLLQVVLRTSAFPNRQHTCTFARISIMKSSSLNEDMIARNIPSDNSTIMLNTVNFSIDVELEQQINQGLQRAKEVLLKSKAKLAAMQQSTATEIKDNDDHNAVVLDVPFFASRLTTSPIANVGGVTTATAIVSDMVTTTTTTTKKTDSNNLKVKSRNSDTGLVMADGERMAEISEDEPWEYRSIYEMFDNNNYDAETTSENKPLRVEMKTDVMASIQNLRKVLQQEDYRKIFDPRNRFIGEDN